MKSWLIEPEVYFFASGVGEGMTSLNAFDAAVLAAGVGNTNLIKLSSIIPPNCVECEPIKLPKGAAIPVAYAYISSDVPGEVISAAVAAAIPNEEGEQGVIMEYSANGHKEDIEAIVRAMAEEGIRMRGLTIKSLKSAAVEHKVARIGGAFSGVVLWYK